MLEVSAWCLDARRRLENGAKKRRLLHPFDGQNARPPPLVLIRVLLLSFHPTSRYEVTRCLQVVES